MEQVAVFAGGCFWCTEAIFKELNGVKSVLPGYSGDGGEEPTYMEVSTGTTGFAEAIKVEFDSNEISYEQLLKVFFLTHDPTTLNRQGNDVGPQYRSVVFYMDDQQKEVAEKVKKEIQDLYDDEVVTEITEFKHFYTASEEHINYYEKNPDQAYCRVVIDPKIQKLRKEFVNLLKKKD